MCDHLRCVLASLVALALATSFGCTLDESGLLPPNQDPRGGTPRTSAIFCDIEDFTNQRHCASTQEQTDGIRLSSSAVALVQGRSSTIGLDYSPDALARCNGVPEALVFKCPFPEGCPVCLTCGGNVVGGWFPSANDACVNFCVEKNVQWPGNINLVGTLLFCLNPDQATHARRGGQASSSGNQCFSNACTDAGALRPDFVDLRRSPEPVTWTNLWRQPTQLIGRRGVHQRRQRRACVGLAAGAVDISPSVSSTSFHARGLRRVRQRARRSGRASAAPGSRQRADDPGQRQGRAGDADSYDFSVPVEDSLSTRREAQPVTGTIDLAAGTIQMEIVCASKVDAGILGSADGTLTGTITGHIIFPDTDGDGVPDYKDNCPQFLNRDQRPIASPILTAPPPITLGSCRNRNFGVAVAIDVCYADPVTVRNDAPGVLAPGPNPITWTATDTHDETAVARQIVTVVDRTPPLLRCESTDGRRHGHDDGDDHDGMDDHDAEHGQADALRSANEAHDGLFRVTSRDACTAQPTIQLGRYALANGELIQLTPVRQPGVTLVADPRSRFRHFLVGPGDAVVSSGDSSGNVASVTCPVALHHQASHHR